MKLYGNTSAAAGAPHQSPSVTVSPRGSQRARIKRAMAEAAGWLCLLGLVIVVAAMESGVLRPLAGGGIGLGLELIGALALCKAGVIHVR